MKNKIKEYYVLYHTFYLVILPDWSLLLGSNLCGFRKPRPIDKHANVKTL